MASILIVDDVEDIRLAYQLLLEVDGHDVALADSTHKALTMMKLDQYDLVITDLVMPDGDGFELVNKIRQMPHIPKTIMVSGGGDKLSLPQALEMAHFMFDGVLSKPVSGQELKAKVNDVLTG